MDDWRVSQRTTPAKRKRGRVSNSRNERGEKIQRYPEKDKE